MSPHQFAHSTSTTSMNNNAQQGEEGSKVTTTTTTTQEVGPREPVGLSRDQLQQALLYLIKVGAPVIIGVMNTHVYIAHSTFQIYLGYDLTTSTKHVHS